MLKDVCYSLSKIMFTPPPRSISPQKPPWWSEKQNRGISLATRAHCGTTGRRRIVGAEPFGKRRCGRRFRCGYRGVGRGFRGSGPEVRPLFFWSSLFIVTLLLSGSTVVVEGFFTLSGILDKPWPAHRCHPSAPSFSLRRGFSVPTVFEPLDLVVA